MTRTAHPPAPFDAIYTLPTCKLGARAQGQQLHKLVFLPPETLALPPHTALLRQLSARLDAWLANAHSPLEAPHPLHGTPFQRRVWQAISAIPPGQTRRYGELVAQAGGTARAIGQACGANPLPLLIPCHRVVAASGLGGFANASTGWLIETKQWLQQHEAGR